ncbi:respiratory nitrate reductase subunit gamma [Streptomyces sp. NPDC006283]|uniref:respiratory nitrate reductase subunit gamma n=1 Tax=Streptomyces sp. NPDC006283 TaxID=3156741 RepID=UPI00339E0C87
MVDIGGTVWRYRYDQFGWPTSSAELYGSRPLRIGSPLFHFGILVVVIGHVIGLVVPESHPTELPQRMFVRRGMNLWQPLGVWYFDAPARGAHRRQQA